jgi:hypothetical protein
MKREKTVIAQERHYFWFEEVVSAAALAGAVTVPFGIYLTRKNGSVLSLIIAEMIFLLLFIFLPKLIQKGMSTDTDTIIGLFGKNEQVKKGVPERVLHPCRIRTGAGRRSGNSTGSSPAAYRHGRMKTLVPFFPAGDKNKKSGRHNCG